MIASLGMYDRAETATANDRLWDGVRDGLRARGFDAPEDLTRGEAAYWPAWEASDLVFSQTCGFPYRARLHDHVTLIGSPDYALPGCAPGHYNSVFVVRANDPRQTLTDFAQARFAYNDKFSQSGWAAPQTHAGSLGFQFAPGLQSGSHRLSALAVAEGRADIAAMDALTFAMCQRYDAFMADLRDLGRTDPTPALPFIAWSGADADACFAALSQAVADLGADDRRTLGLRAVVKIPAAAYLAVPTPPSPEMMIAQLGQRS